MNPITRILAGTSVDLANHIEDADTAASLVARNDPQKRRLIEEARRALLSAAEAVDTARRAF